MFVAVHCYCYSLKVLILNNVIGAVFLMTLSVLEHEITCRQNKTSYGHVSKLRESLKSTFTSKTLISSNFSHYVIYTG